MVTRAITPPKRRKPTRQVAAPKKRAQTGLGHLPKQVRSALADFQRRVLELFPNDVLQIALFGSYARGDARPDSDVDVMVVVNWKDPKGGDEFYSPGRSDPRYARLMDLALDTSIEYSVNLSVHPITERDFNSDNPLAGEAKHAGRVLWRRKGWKMADEEEKHPANLHDPKTWMAMAEDKLDGARKNLLIERYNETVSIAYYAMFYAARAALLTKSVYLIKHTAAQAKFSELFVATGVVEPKFAAYLGKGQEDRERGDYEPYNPFSRTEAEEFLNKAEAFVAKVKELIESQKQE